MSEFADYLKKYAAWASEKRDLFKELKSFRFFSQAFGGNTAGYVEMWEFESLTDLEKRMKNYFQDKEAAVWHQQWLSLIVPETWSLSVWNLVGDFTNLIRH